MYKKKNSKKKKFELFPRIKPMELVHTHKREQFYKGRDWKIISYGDGEVDDEEDDEEEDST